MSRIGLISNPLSQQNKRGADSIDAVAGRLPGVLHRRLDRFATLPTILREFAERDVAVIAISSGDGTVQGVMTDLFENRPFKSIPPLALLPRGMTNMTAADVGLRGKPEKALPRLAALLDKGRLDAHLLSRHVLRVENVADMPPQRAMFFGAAGVFEAIELCQTKVHPLRIQADWAAGVTFAGMLLHWLFGRRQSAVTPEDIGVRLDGNDLGTTTRLLVLATTLDRLVMRSRPFWNEAHGPVRFTGIDYPPRNLLRHAARVLYGSHQVRHLPSGYYSRGARRLEFSMDCPFTLDGQPFRPTPGKPLIVTADDTVRFVR
jgi:hypothetical protein